MKALLLLGIVATGSVLVGCSGGSSADEDTATKPGNVPVTVSNQPPVGGPGSSGAPVGAPAGDGR